MKFSIITAVFNREKTIKDSIDSVKDQGVADLEHIICDGKSTDRTLSVVENNLSELILLSSVPDSGMYEAINRGLKLSKGDIIGLLHSDDQFYSADVLKKVSQVFDENPEINLVYGDGVYVRDDDNRKLIRKYSSSKFSRWKLFFGWIPLHTTFFIRSELIKEIGLYSTFYSISSDYDWSLRVFKSSNVRPYYLRETLVKMKLGGKSTTASLQTKKSSEDLEIINKNKLWGYFTLCFKILRKLPQFIIK